MYTLSNNGKRQNAEWPSLQEAIDEAGYALGLTADRTTTIAIQNGAGEVVASLSNRRITGTIVKQQWGGPKAADAIRCGEESFDATDEVLLLPLEALVELEDNSEQTDAIGRHHVSWPGPCTVYIVDDILAFFGVMALEEITPEHLAFVRGTRNPQPMPAETVTLQVKVKVRVARGASVRSFVDNLDYTVTSNTPGIVVEDTEIVDAD